MSSQRVFSRGVYHGLPHFSVADGKQYTAIVVGANGITGSHIIRALLQSSNRWQKIYSLSRKPPSVAYQDPVKQVSLDLLKSPDEIASVLGKELPQVDFVFFAAYLQPPPKPGQGLWSDTDETEKVNVALLSNFLSALEISQRLPKRFVLQTGAKHYGVHLGPTLTPMEESDPRFPAEKNFYFSQEDVLWDWAERNDVEWNVTRPGFIIGAVPEAAMTIAWGLGLYAAIQKELGGPLDFYGDLNAWGAEKHLSSALLIGYHAEWTVLTPGAKNQVLNIADDSLFTYGKFWPILASIYDIPYNGPRVQDDEYQTVTMPTSPPPRGFGPAGSFRLSGSFEEWAKRSQVQEAWQRLKRRYDLQPRNDPFQTIQEIFGLMDGEILGSWGRSLSVGKSRKLGWHGYVDTHESLIQTFQELADLKMIPPIGKGIPLNPNYLGY